MGLFRPRDHILMNARITIPILPQVDPNASATRVIFSANGPGASRLTTIAAVIKANNLSIDDSSVH